MDRATRSSPRFKSWHSYSDFEHQLKQTNGNRADPDVKQFLDAMLASARKRLGTVGAGVTMCRAQKGVCSVPLSDGPPILTAFPPERMKPIAHIVGAGRANREGTCVLYLANSEETAISEARPWIGSRVSVAYFKLKRPISIIDLSREHGSAGFLLLTLKQLEPSAKIDKRTLDKAVWADMDNAFSRPVDLDEDKNRSSYLPTQIIAEVLREAGYDAIMYRSNFGERGYNLALFDPDAAEYKKGVPHRVTSITVKFEEDGEPRWP